jgi:DNA-binding CsgD family transcriptional regulator
MSQKEKRISDLNFSKRVEGGVPPGDDFEDARLSVARAGAVEQAGAAIARQLNAPLTALLLYMGEIKQHSHQLSLAAADKLYLQQVVENALQQTERFRAMIKQMADSREAAAAMPALKTGPETPPGPAADGSRAAGVTSPAGAGRRPLTRREREVLNLVSEGHSNKQGALLMRISPRTFESHRAEAMRKLGARNTAELVRSAFLHSGAV